MHIAQFSNAYHPVISGVVRSVSSFRQALTDQGHNVFIFAQHTSNYQDAEPFIFRYPAIDIPMNPNFPLAIPISPFMDKLIPILKLDVIHSHHPFLLGRAAASKANELKLPLVFTFHTRYREYSHYLPLDQDFVKDVIDFSLGDYMQKCHHIVVPSDSIKQMLADDYGVTDRITTIPTGIDLELYDTADANTIRQERGWGQDRVLISIGRLAKEKNWETLLAAAARVMRNRANVRLVIIGDGDERKALEKSVRKLAIADRVEFTGHVPYTDVCRFLKAADIFCFASITETQGLVTMEALAAGLPVAAVAATGTSDVVEHGKQGLLTDDDSEALARAIGQVIDDEALLKRFKQAAKDRAKVFDIMRQTERLLDVYRQAIEDQEAKRFVSVDKRKRIFELIIDEEQWTKLLGGERRSST